MNESCPKCGARVIHATTKHDIELTLDPEPAFDGSVLVMDKRATFLSGQLLMEARKLNLPMHTPHNATCKETK